MELAVPGVFQLALDREERQLEAVLNGHAQRRFVDLLLGFGVEGVWFRLHLRGYTLMARDLI